VKYNQVGNSGLKVSELSLNAMTLGRETTSAEAGRIVAKRSSAASTSDYIDVYYVQR
jgi:aryl-alcohol dehydrogenase-like predicted oxidoreductase